MQKKMSKRKNELSLPIRNILSFLLSSVSGIVTSVMISLFLSFFLSNSDNSQSYYFIYLIFSVIIGAFVCGFLGSSMLMYKGIISGLVCCVPYIIAMYSMMFIFSHGKLNAYSLFLVLVIVISSAIGGITNANIKRRK